MKNFQFSKYCTPAQLYLILGAIGILSAFIKKFSIETLLTQALFLVIWAWVLNWLCSKGFKAISWILVLLPFIMVLFMFLFVKDVVKVKEGAKLSDDPKKREGQIQQAAADAAKGEAERKKNPPPAIKNIPQVDNSDTPIAKAANIALDWAGGQANFG